jgi:hypothetical protein
LKKWILELLSAIKISMEKYWIDGADGLRRASSYVLRELLHYIDEMRKPENEWWAKSV